MRRWPGRSRSVAARAIAPVQLHGGAGHLHWSEVERRYRDVRIPGIGGGVTEVLDDRTARLLGRAP